MNKEKEGRAGNFLTYREQERITLPFNSFLIPLLSSAKTNVSHLLLEHTEQLEVVRLVILGIWFFKIKTYSALYLWMKGWSAIWKRWMNTIHWIEAQSRKALLEDASFYQAGQCNAGKAGYSPSCVNMEAVGRTKDLPKAGCGAAPLNIRCFFLWSGDSWGL